VRADVADREEFAIPADHTDLFAPHRHDRDLTLGEGIRLPDVREHFSRPEPRRLAAALVAEIRP